MSGFGLRAFKALKQDSTTNEKRLYIQNLVVGNDFFAIKKLLKLQNSLGRESVRLLSERELSKEALLSQWKCTPKLLRNKEALSDIIGLFPRLEIIPEDSPCTFYKDTKFHEFGGRAKSFELKPLEEYFTRPSADYRLDLFFSDEEWNHLDDTLQETSFNKIIEKIEMTSPEDLVEKTNFIIYTGENERIECEKLYYFDSPKKLLKLIKNNEELPDSLHEFSSSIQERAGLVVHFSFPKKLHEKKETVFLPQSVTHEWGHFICDFEAYDEFSKKQEATVLMLIQDDDGGSEEELAKKIRLMKRVMERIYPEMSKMEYQEHIHYSDEMFLADIPDQVSNLGMESLQILGVGAPLDNKYGELSVLERGLLSFK